MSVLSFLRRNAMQPQGGLSATWAAVTGGDALHAPIAMYPLEGFA